MLNIERDTNCYTKNSIPKPPKVVHDDVNVTAQLHFWSLFSRASLGPVWTFGHPLEYEFVLDGNAFKSVNGELL